MAKYKGIVVKEELYQELLNIMYEKRLRSVPQVVKFLVGYYKLKKQEERGD